MRLFVLKTVKENHYLKKLGLLSSTSYSNVAFLDLETLRLMVADLMLVEPGWSSFRVWVWLLRNGNIDVHLATILILRKLNNFDLLPHRV